MLSFKNAFTKGDYFLGQSNDVWLYKDFYLTLLNSFYLYLGIFIRIKYNSKIITNGWHISERRLYGLNLLHEQLLGQEW